MNKNFRFFTFLLAILMSFILSGCPATTQTGTPPSTGSIPVTTAPTGSSASQYDEAYITALTGRLEDAKSAAIENYDAAWTVVFEDLHAIYSSDMLESLIFAEEAKMQAILTERTAALSQMIDELQNMDQLDAAAVAAKVTEAEQMLSENYHDYGAVIRYSGNADGISCTDAEHYQICAKCNALKWSKGEHRWYYVRDRLDHQMCCQQCTETAPVAQHNTNEQGRCAECNYLQNANILIIENIEGESAALSGMLDSSHSLTVANVHNPAELPASVEALQVYDEVILCNIANADLPAGFDQLLHTYVYDLGGSLFTVGGDNAYDPEDMGGTTYQDMLPVDIANYVPSLGVMIIIDRSGSMSYTENPNDFSKLDAAKEGAKACLEALTEHDCVGIMSLGDIDFDCIEMIPQPEQDKILASIDSIQGGGGTILSDALEVAGRKLNALSGVERKHIIIVTDGEFDARDQERYLYAFEENAKNGITTSIVGIQCPNAVRQKMMLILEEYAGGSADNFHSVIDLSTTGSFLREDLERPELREISYESFIPTIDPTHPIAANIGELPALSGFYGSKLKADADAILTKGNLPLYAQWQYGKGTVGSFMCDLNGTWSTDFINAEEGSALINSIVSHLANSTQSDTEAPDETPEPNQVFALFPSMIPSAWIPDNSLLRIIR